MTLVRLAVALALAAAVLPAPASAATVTAEPGLIDYQAEPGESNDVIVDGSWSEDWVFTENGGVLNPGPGCRRGASTSEVRCARTGFADYVTVHLGDGDDRAQAEPGMTGALYGDAGDDLLTGSPDGGYMDGGPGADDLTCRHAECNMVGGTGPDRMRGTIDPKAYPNGRGRAFYSDHATGVTVTLDGVNNDGNLTDGPAGQRDNVTAVSEVIGGPGNDRLFGGPQEAFEVHTLSGGPGDDELRGLGATDILRGQEGADRLYGGDGGDNLFPDEETTGWSAGDVSSGGAGEDLVYYRRPLGVRVSLNGVADDGRDADGDEVAEERDNVLADVEDVLAGDGDDVLQGSAADNALAGGSGQDRIAGGGGGDRLFGQDGDDKLDGGTESDELKGATGDDVLSGGADADRLFGELDDDSLDGGTGADFLSGSFGLDTVSYAARTGAIVATMASGADDGADTDADGAADEGDDIRPDVEHYLGSSGPDRVTGNASANRLFGNAAGDRLAGAGGNDLLDGGPAGDILDGAIGNDRFNQGKLPDGADEMVGGDGADTADYSQRIGEIAVAIDATGDDGDTLRDENDFVRTDVEAVLGGSAADVLTGAAVDNRLSGGGGDDILDGGLGADDLAGGSGDDTVTYGTRTGAVTADLDGVADDGTAADANASSVRDRIGTDVERLTGGSGADRLTGSAFANRLTGGPGPDVLTGGGAIDVLRGGSGDDDLFSRGDAAADDADCESGLADEITADLADAVANCEIVR